MELCVVKISVSSLTDYYHIDDVVYYRSGMSPDFIQRWQWFFEYIAARVKVANPHRKVEFYKGPQTILLGHEWHEYRRSVLLKTRYSKLKKLVNVSVPADLFGFAQEDHNNKIASLKHQLVLLDSDNFPIPEFPVYINKIKNYI